MPDSMPRCGRLKPVNGRGFQPAAGSVSRADEAAILSRGAVWSTGIFGGIRVATTAAIAFPEQDSPARQPRPAEFWIRVSISPVEPPQADIVALMSEPRKEYHTERTLRAMAEQLRGLASALNETADFMHQRRLRGIDVLGSKGLRRRRNGAFARIKTFSDNAWVEALQAAREKPPSGRS